MPGNEATVGHLTSEFHDAVTARPHLGDLRDLQLLADIEHVGCAQDSVRRARAWSSASTSTPTKAIPPASRRDCRGPRCTGRRNLPDGQPIVSHTKFIIVDHEVVLLTSANFSYSAENRNVEFGLLIRDNGLAASIESTMAGKRGTLYQAV